MTKRVTRVPTLAPSGESGETSKSSTHDDRLLRVRDVARLLAISVRGVWRLAGMGQIPLPVKVGGSTRWRAVDIHRLIAGTGCQPSLTESERDVVHQDSAGISAKGPSSLRGY